MVRKNAKVVATYENVDEATVSSIVLATSGHIKNKPVDPRKIVGTIHIKKYLADAKINGKVETWISILKKLSAPSEDGSSPELSADEVEALEDCKRQTKIYLEEEASASLKKKVEAAPEDFGSMKDIASSMKFKFSRFAYETVTHVINLMVRELLVFTCDNCASQKNKLTKVSHVPWSSLQGKLMSGLYMNTKAVFDAVHPKTEEVVEEATTEEAVEEEAATEEATTEESGEEVVVDEVKASKPRLSQYISNTFKEVVSRDERFKGLLLGKEITALINDIIFQVLDRYANVIKSLLQTANSKTVNERLAVIATKILLQDHVHATDSDVAVVLDVVQARLEQLKATPEEEEEAQPAEEVAPPAKVASPKSKKASKQ